MSLVKKSLAKAKSIGVESSKKPAEQETKVATNNVVGKVERPAIMQEFDMLTIGIESDLAQLKTFSDRDQKQEYKAQALEKNDYLGYVQRYIQVAANHPNIVLAWVFIWLVDLCRWETVIKHLPMMVNQQQPLPTAFNTKSWVDFLIDQIYDYANKQLSKGLTAIEETNIVKYISMLIELIENNEWQINDVCKGKLYAIAHKLELARFNYGNAIRLGVLAQKANEKAGVKKSTQQIAKQLGVEIEI